MSKNPTMGIAIHPHLQHFDALPDSAFVDINIVAALFGVSKATIQRGIKAGTFPAPVSMEFCSHTRFRVRDIRAAKAK